jgi:hypothetical protein
MNNGAIQKCGTHQEIFSDPELLRENRLKVPLFVQTYLELKAGEICNGAIPLTVTDLMETIATWRNRRTDPGEVMKR